MPASPQTMTRKYALDCVAALATPWLATQYTLLAGAQVAAFGWATWLALTVLLLAVFLVAHFPARRAARAEPAASLHEL